jgi:ABC-type amino acid transport substrate-binding protein
MKRKCVKWLFLVMLTMAIGLPSRTNQVVASSKNSKVLQQPKVSMNQALPKTAKQSKTMKRIKAKGVIVIGSAANRPPCLFHRTLNGKDEVLGYDLDIMKEIAKALGVKLQVKDLAFDGLLPALSAGNIDCIVSSMARTPERMKNADFSIPYHWSSQVLVIKKPDRDKFKTLNDFKKAKIGVQKASTQEVILHQNIPTAEPFPLSKLSDVFLALKNLRIDAVLIDKPIANCYITINPEFALSGVEWKPGMNVIGSAVAFRKGSQDLVDVSNMVLATMMGTGILAEAEARAVNQVDQSILDNK